jgi:SnoaL-like domain
LVSMDELVDRAQITEVLYNYAHGVDRQDIGLLRSCYHEDAYDNHGAYQGGVDGLVEWITTRHRAIEQSFHLIGNVLINLRGDEAWVESYCLAFQRLRQGVDPPSNFEFAKDAPHGDGSITSDSCLRYVDLFTKRDGVWRISRRTVAFEWRRPGLRDETSLLKPGWAVATRDRTDPYFSAGPDHSP